MGKTDMPSKDAVRTWLTQELKAHRPPPTPERIREILGWKLIRQPEGGKQ